MPIGKRLVASLLVLGLVGPTLLVQKLYLEPPVARAAAQEQHVKPAAVPAADTGR